MDKSKCIIVNDLIANMRTELNSLIDTPDKLIEFINANLKPKDAEKKKFGEVFTPLNLINEMLDKLPIDVWTNKKLKWFEPASGMGNFTICVYLRLLENLRSQFKSEEATKNHILTKMLYMSELNPKNVLICKQIFGNVYINLHEGDTLTIDTEQEWGIKNFDIVMGNPPFQDASGNRGKGHTLWTRFIEKSLNSGWVKNGGYLVFITPSGWRQLNDLTGDLIKSFQMTYLSIHNEKDGFKIFKANTRYDWYIIRKTSPINKTVVDGEDKVIEKIMLKDWSFVPNFNFTEIHKKIASSPEERCEIIKDRSNYGSDKKHTSKIKTSEFQYPLIYSIKRSGEITFMWSSLNNKGHFGIPKVVFGGGATGFISDPKGKYGLTEWCSGILAPIYEHKNIIEYLESDKFNKIKRALSVGKAEINTKILRLFKKDFWNEL